MSPIKNLTDNVAPSFQRLGKLRKGAEAEERTNSNGQKYNSYGKELSYWRFASDRPEVVAAFEQAYGREPVFVNVFLPYADGDENFATWREEWTAGGLVHRCDGETMSIWRTPDGKYSQEPRPCPHRGKDKPACKPVGRLSVIIPELFMAGYVGYVTMETHSINDLMRITSVLRAVEIASNGNTRGLQGIPFILRRVPEEISTPGEDGKRVRRTKYLVNIEPAADWVSLQLAAAKRIAYGDERLALTDGRTVDASTGEVFGPRDADEEPPDYDEGDFTTEPPPVVTQPAPPAVLPPPPPSNGAPACPVCKGPMWDNAAKKASGEMKLNAPDYKCKDRNCDGKIWPPKNGNGNGNGAPTPEYAAMSKAAKAHFGKDGVKQGLLDLMAIYGVTDSHALTPAQCAEITEKIGYLQQGAPLYAADEIPF